MIRFFSLVLSVLAVFVFTVSAQVNSIKKLDDIKSNFKELSISKNFPPRTKISDISFDEKKEVVSIALTKEALGRYYREEDVLQISTLFKGLVDQVLKQRYSMAISVAQTPIEELIPNFYRTSTPLDMNRLPKGAQGQQIVLNTSRPYSIISGLQDRNLALWQSHGWYYAQDVDRWEWQRARLFQTVEDLLPMSFIVPYLLPMLENSGANVYVPRERDFQIEEVIIDNDDQTDIQKKKLVLLGKDKANWKNEVGRGFKKFGEELGDGINPFMQGSYQSIEGHASETASIKYIPMVKQHGDFGVYISFASLENSCREVLYKVYHSGGVTEFIINQTMGGFTWIYLGKFNFDANSTKQGVEISNKTNDKNTIITTDAVRFGGGMGVVSKGGRTSGRPKYVEGARYWLQFAGMPDTLVYYLNGGINDYTDDYQSRAEYGNYLMGSPNGPNRERNNPGLGIPIDAMMAFHTDAGTTPNDSSIGTLLIYSRTGTDKDPDFPTGYSRLANRDFADIMQTQIVNDIQALYDPTWTRRDTREATYSESSRPNTPAVLLELLSHQNFWEIQFAQHPEFKFSVSRSIYKAILKFLSKQYGVSYTVHPLPVKNASALLTKGGAVELKWEPTADALELTADPDKYIIYKAIGKSGFDNGTVTNRNSYTVSGLEKGKIYRFKIAAANSGGESMQSEELSVCYQGEKANEALIVNNFTRLDIPAVIDEPDFRGFVNVIDEGVQEGIYAGYVGEQYDYNPQSPFTTNDMPGHGASFASFETERARGNSFDFTDDHGESFVKLGWSYSSMSIGAFEKITPSVERYEVIDLLCGEQKQTKLLGKQAGQRKHAVFSPILRRKLDEWFKSSGNVIITGAYITTDPFESPDNDTTDLFFVKSKLKVVHTSGKAAQNGEMIITKSKERILFNQDYNEQNYRVESPGAFNPIDGASTFIRYSENDFSAGVFFKKKYGVALLGVPLEVIYEEEQRTEVLRRMLKGLGF